MTVRSRQCRSDRGFSLVEATVAAALIGVVATATIQAMLATVVLSESSARTQAMERLLRTARAELTELGYHRLAASGAAAVGADFVAVHAKAFAALGPRSELGVAFAQTVPGKMLDATVSIRIVVRNSVRASAIVFRVAT